MTTWFFARSGMIALPVRRPYGNPNRRHRIFGARFNLDEFRCPSVHCALL
jgi:hypothetical protein